MKKKQKKELKLYERKEKKPCLVHLNDLISSLLSSPFSSSVWTGQSLIQFFRFLKLITTPPLFVFTHWMFQQNCEKNALLSLCPNRRRKKRKCVERQRFLDTPPSKECEICLWKQKKKKKMLPNQKQNTGVAQGNNIWFKPAEHIEKRSCALCGNGSLKDNYICVNAWNHGGRWGRYWSDQPLLCWNAERQPSPLELGWESLAPADLCRPALGHQMCETLSCYNPTFPLNGF